MILCYRRVHSKQMHSSSASSKHCLPSESWWLCVEVICTNKYKLIISGGGGRVIVFTPV